MRRGELWWGNLPPPFGHRPVLLLARDEAYLIRDLITVAPITTRIRGIPAEVRLGIADGLRRACVANLDAMYTVSKGALQERITILGPAKMREVEAAIHFALGLET
jgi:mRNA interferase MazF